MRQRIGYYFGLLLVAIIHLILYASLLFRSVKLNIQDGNAIVFVIFLMIVPVLLTIVGVLRGRAVWMYTAFICYLPSLYVFFAGNGFAKWFIASPVLFLINAIILQVRQRTATHKKSIL